MRRYLPVFLVIVAHTGGAQCPLHGTVVDAASGKPLSAARVFATLQSDAHDAAILRLTDARGAFCFERLAPGDYRLSASRAGYLDAVYGAPPGRDRGATLTIDGRTQVSAVTIQLLRPAAIGGVVLDPNGEPLETASVTLLSKVWNEGWDSNELKSTYSDDRGAFRFSQLAPGTYYLSVEPYAGGGGKFLDEKGQPILTNAAATFYSGSLTFTHATPIALAAGQDLGNLVLTMSQTSPRRFTGRVSGSLSKDPGEKTLLYMYPAVGGARAFPEILADGTFTAEGLEPQKYSVRTRGVEPFAQLEIDLTAGDVTGFVIEPKRLFGVRLSVTLDGKPVTDYSPIHARDVEKGAVIESGRGAFGSIPPGLYKLDGGSDGLYLKSLIIDGKPRSDTVLDLRSGPASVEAVMSRNVARIEGMLEGALPRFAVTVVWMDEEKSRTEVVGKTVAPDPAGKFKIESLAPGRYRVFAIEGFDSDLWGSPELAAALRERSAAIELREDQTGQVTVPVISFDDWTAALRKAGM